MKIECEEQCFYCKHYKQIINVHTFAKSSNCIYGVPITGLPFKCSGFDFNKGVKVYGTKHGKSKNYFEVKEDK